MLLLLIIPISGIAGYSVACLLSSAKRSDLEDELQKIKSENKYLRDIILIKEGR